MGTYVYRGFDAAGRRRSGFVEALDPKDGRERLAAQGLFVERLDTASKDAAASNAARLDAERRAFLYREVAALLKAGLPLAQALEIVLQDASGRGYAASIAAIRDRIREGGSLADGLSAASRVLGANETAAIHAGERSGRLAEVLAELADFLDDQQALRESILSALLYPALIVVLALALGVGLLVFVLPSLRELFSESGLQMPLLTRAMFAASGALPWAAPLALALGALAVVAWRRQWTTNESFRIRVEQGLERTPGVGRFFRLVTTIRFSRTLACLLRGGVPAVEALSLTGPALGSAWLARAVERETEAVRHGRPLADSILAVPCVGAALSGWAHAGVASGDLPGMLDRAAERYTRAWKTDLARAVKLAEPILILAVGVFVLLIALAILLPILALNRTIG